MKLIHHFAGANIRVLSQETDTVYLDVDLRDTDGDWFYWCFKVENAAGKTVTFRFPNDTRVGYYGAAVSHDYVTWQWQYEDSGHQGDSFTYTFGETENEVYFAHDMLYRPEQWEMFAKENALPIHQFCRTAKGNVVPYLDIGSGDEVIVLTARHHACEATGNYVLEGILGELLRNAYFRKYRIICVPFVDLDGVVEGDQGKNRRPYDHNRDYDETTAARYATTAKLREIAETVCVKYAFDFHSPWHLGGENDTVFIPMHCYESVNDIQRISALWEQWNNDTCLRHYQKHDVLPDVRWNKMGSPTAARYFFNHGAKLAFTVETPYFVADGVTFSPQRARETGRHFASALWQYDRMTLMLDKSPQNRYSLLY